MADKRKGLFGFGQGVQTAEKSGILTGNMQRRDFGKLLGAHTVLLSTLSLAACGGGGGDDDTPKVYPVATPIADTVAQPATIGSYQRKNGYFTWSVTASGASRDIEVYIPPRVRASANTGSASPCPTVCRATSSSATLAGLTLQTRAWRVC